MTNPHSKPPEFAVGDRVRVHAPDKRTVFSDLHGQIGTIDALDDAGLAYVIGISWAYWFTPQINLVALDVITELGDLARD